MLCILPPRRRDSKWANSALVVTVQPGDWAHLEGAHGPLAGMALQQEVRRWWAESTLLRPALTWRKTTFAAACCQTRPVRNTMFAQTELAAVASQHGCAPPLHAAPLNPAHLQFEREAARRGGGAFVAPAQRVSDFLAGRAPREPLPASSYR